MKRIALKIVLLFIFISKMHALPDFFNMQHLHTVDEEVKELINSTKSDLLNCLNTTREALLKTENALLKAETALNTADASLEKTKEAFDRADATFDKLITQAPKIIAQAGIVVTASALAALSVYLIYKGEKESTSNNNNNKWKAHLKLGAGGILLCASIAAILKSNSLAAYCV